MSLTRYNEPLWKASSIHQPSPLHSSSFYKPGLGHDLRISGIGRLARSGSWYIGADDSTETVLALELTSTEAYLWLAESRGGINEGTQPTYLGRQDDRESGATQYVS